VRSTSGHRRRVVVAQAGVRGVEQPPASSRSPARAPAHHRVDARVLGEDVAARAASGSGRRSSRPCASRSDAMPSRSRRLAALAAALVVAGLGDRVRGAGVERHERPVAESSGRVDPSDGSRSDGVPGCRTATASWSSSRSRADPVVLTRETGLASSRGRPARLAGTASRRGKRGRAGRARRGRSRARGRLDREPAGAARSRGGQLGDRAAHERAPARSARRGERERSRSPSRDASA
jgi:hypothetical protein